MSAVLSLLLAAWPDASASLTVLPAPPVPARPLRIYVDAGHGAPGNEGNHGCFCQREQDHTAQVAMHLAYVLARLGPFEVKLSRQEATGRRYPARIAEAEGWKADAIVSLHSDARGWATPWGEGEGQVCWRNDTAPGFAVLWSDDAPDEVVAKRASLGRAVGRRLTEAGFLAYSGEDYGSLYRQDPESPSGWIDLRPRKKSVYFLRASTIPTVIVETHHALDPREVQRWEELSTVDAFALAVANALVDALAPQPAAARSSHLLRPPGLPSPSHLSSPRVVLPATATTRSTARGPRAPPRPRAPRASSPPRRARGPRGRSARSAASPRAVPGPPAAPRPR